MYTLRLKFPRNYLVPPHTHVQAEHVTVISGDMHFEMGSTVNMGTAQRLRTGNTITSPANEPHYVHALAETVVEVRGMGPFRITYVNPTDDPRRQ